MAQIKINPDDEEFDDFYADGSPFKKIRLISGNLDFPSCSSMSPVSSPINCSYTSESEILKTQNCPYLDGTYFKVVEYDEKDKKFTAECQLCLPKKKNIRGTLGISTNFLKHLKTIHKNSNALEDYKRYKLIKKQNTLVKTTEPKIELPRQNIQQIKVTDDFKIQKNNNVQKKFDERIIKFLTSNMIAINIIENPFFIKLFEGFNVKVMSRCTVMEKIQDTCDNILTILQNEIDTTKYICTTIDIWSAEPRSFFSMTCHWIDNSFQRHSAALACKKIKGKYTYDTLADMIKETHSKFGLNNEKIVVTISDNVFNLIKAFQEFGVNFFVNNDEDNDYESQCESDDEMQFDQIRLPYHLHCITHTLNLIAIIDIKHAIDSNAVLRSQHYTTISKCNTLWKMCTFPKSMEIIKKVLGHTLRYPETTKWNTLYDGLSQIIDERKQMTTLFNALGMNNKFLTETELNYITEYCLILKPLANVIDILQGEKNMFFGYLLPCLGSLLAKLEIIEIENENISTLPILKACRAGILKRFESFLNISTKEGKEAIVAAFSLPKFKLKWVATLQNKLINNNNTNDCELNDVIIKLILDTIIENNMDTETETETKNFPVYGLKEDEFFTFNSTISFTTNYDRKKRIELEILNYINDSNLQIDTLNKYPSIKSLFFRFNTCLPSSAPVEKLFSFTEFCYTPSKNNLSNRHFENLVLLKANSSRYET